MPRRNRRARNPRGRTRIMPQLPELFDLPAGTPGLHEHVVGHQLTEDADGAPLGVRALRLRIMDADDWEAATASVGGHGIPRREPEARGYGIPGREGRSQRGDASPRRDAGKAES